MYRVIHFEALGAEEKHLHAETVEAIKSGNLPSNHTFLTTPLTLQEFTAANPLIKLPQIVTVKTHSKIPESWLFSTESKNGIITRSAGYDHLEQLAGKAHITSLREYCVSAVAQTTMKFLYAAAGMLNRYEKLTAAFQRAEAPSFMELGTHRRATVFGVGKIGRAIYDLLLANGLDARGVDIRERELSKHYGDSVRFISKEEAMTTSDIVINAMNLTRNSESPFYNCGYFSSELFSLSQKPLIFINVTRGEIAPENLLLQLLESGEIIGLGLDVFTDESEFAKVLSGHPDYDKRFDAAKTLLDLSINRSANVYLQPHQGFNSDLAASNKASETLRHLVAWFRNDAGKFDEELPYYS